MKFEIDGDELQELITNRSSVELISPAAAVKRFLNMKTQEIRPLTIEEYHGKLKHFLTFWEDCGINNLNDLDGRPVDKFRTYCRTETPESSSFASEDVLERRYDESDKSDWRQIRQRLLEEVRSETDQGGTNE